MNPEKFGKLIKEIRKKNNLTQKEFANLYNVTYQAVSKWERGLNMPDAILLKKISEDYNLSLEHLLDGEYKPKKKHQPLIITIIVLLIVAIITIVYLLINNDFKFKTITTACSNFNISGTISYNSSKSAIYITNIEYCGGDDMENYKKIECILYETYNDTEKKISSYIYDESNPIKLEDFLSKVTLTVDNYEQNCKDYDNNIYLTINATNEEGKTTTYNIPLKLESCGLN